MSNGKQIGGNHYENKRIQPWDCMEDWFGRQALIYALLKDVIKYVCRYKDKNGIEDLRKAHHCLGRVIELEVNGNA